MSTIFDVLLTIFVFITCFHASTATDIIKVRYFNIHSLICREKTYNFNTIIACIVKYIYTVYSFRVETSESV